MEEFAMYLFESVIWLTGFALVYLLFLQNERFFLLKRYYLVSGILISFIFPLFSFHYQVVLPSPDTIPVDFSIPDNYPVTAVQHAAQGKPIDFKIIILFLYLSGVSFLTFKLILNIRSLVNSINKARIIYQGQIKLIRAFEFSSSFSFFNYVFIHPSVSETELNEIINHELVHVSQKHWFDLILIEFLRLLQWANPFAWIYTGFLRLNLEYIADEKALQRTSDPSIYKAALMNQLFSTQVFSLSNSFNYAHTKKRFEMMKKVVTSPYRKLKILYAVPVFAIVLYAFATPEYHYTEPPDNTIILNQPLPFIIKDVKGIVLKENGTPFQEVPIVVTGTSIRATSDASGKFKISDVPNDAFLVFSYRGYKTQVLKAVFNSGMTVKMEKDPDYKESAYQSARPKQLIVVDGVISGAYPPVEDVGIVNSLMQKDAIAKYGEKGKTGVIEITTKKRAAELGIKVPFKRRNPEDFPTFRGEKYSTFNNWVLSQLKYPADAQAKKIEGWIQVNFVVQNDGTLSDIKAGGPGDPVLKEEVIKVIKSSPKWEPAKNPEAKEPFQSSVIVKFKLPDQILNDAPFVVVEQMPMYPGGDAELLKFIAENTQYPPEAKKDNIQGKVIVRFIVNTEGNTEGVSVLKGVHPLLDNEAIRVVSMLQGFKPGYQDGKPVNVWYMVPITFSLPMTNTLK